MARILPKLTVFDTGPDDGLSALDVYQEEAIAATAQPKESVIGKAIAGVTDHPYYIDHSDGSSLDSILEKGVSEIEARRLIDIPLSDSINSLSLIQEFPDLTIDILNETLVNISDSLGINSFLDLTTEELGVYVKTATDVLQSNILCPEGGLDGLFDLSILLSGLQLDIMGLDLCSDSFGIDFDQFLDEQVSFAAQYLMDASSMIGNHGLTASIMSIAGQDTPVSISSEYVNNILGNYSLPGMSVIANHVDIGMELANDLDIISPNWLTYARGDEVVTNLISLGEATVDASEVLKYVPRISGIDVIVDSYDTVSQSIEVLANNRYPLLFL